MNIVYSDHAEKRVRQRGIAKWEVEHILEFPFYVKKSFGGRKEAVGEIKGRTIKVEFFEEENYIKIITVM
ncbi:DUF4258 domain-containing protein [Candidatus Woesearchaeota archaeon]|nr:DUF4258 domain-containing protein [Candidatus Woesearchaeota archaeon]